MVNDISSAVMRTLVFSLLFLVQVKHLLKRQRHSAKTLDEHFQRKLMENGIHKDALSKNMPVNSPAS